MPVQILMCPCYKDYFLQTGKAIISHLGNFHRKCAELAMKMFVHFCKDHPFGSTILNVISSVDEVETNCFCKKKGFSRTKSNVQKRPLQFKL